jgi:hypothetical protein
MRRYTRYAYHAILTGGMMRTLAQYVIGFFLTVLTIFLAASASGQNRSHPVGDLSRKAEIVVVGKVAGTKSEWDRSRDRIITNVTVNVGECLKGNAGNAITITAMGGEVNGVGEWYSHTANFKTDEEVVIFANRDKGGRFRIAGGADGKVKIERDRKSGSAFVHGNKTLADFKKEIAAAIQSQEGK